MGGHPETHHVFLIINKEQEGLFIKNYVCRDVSPYSVRMGSGNVTYSDMTVYQAFVQEDFSHGMGFNFVSDDKGYSRTGHMVDTRFPRTVTLFGSIATTSDGACSSDTIIKFVEHGGAVYAIGRGGVYRLDASTNTWVDIGVPLGIGAVITDAMSDGTYLYVSCDEDVVKRYDGTGWVDNELNELSNPAACKNFRGLTLAGGFAWASDLDRPMVHYAAQESDANSPFYFEGGDPTTGGDPDAIYVGAGNVPITGMISWNSALYVGREDGLWYIPLEVTGSNVTPVAYRVIDYTNQRHSSNFLHMAQWLGKLYYTFRGQIWRYSGATVDNINPNPVGYDQPYTVYKNFRFLVPCGDFLYAVAQEDASPDSEVGYGQGRYGATPYGGLDNIRDVLLAFDGMAWHKLAELTASDSVVSAVGYSPTQHRLYFATNGMSQHILYFQFQSAMGDVLPAYDTALSGTHDGAPQEWLRDNGGLWSANEGMAYNLIGQPVYNLTWGGEGVVTAYRLNAGVYELRCEYLGGTPMSWLNGDRYLFPHAEGVIFPDRSPHFLYMSEFHAGLATVPKHFRKLEIHGELNNVCMVDAWASLDDGPWFHLGLAREPQSILLFPPENSVGKKVALRLNLITIDSGVMPVLERVVLHYIPRPSTIYSFEFDVLMANETKLLDMSVSPETAFEIYQKLLEARASVHPIGFVDPWGIEHEVYVTAVTWRPVRMEYKDTNMPQELEGVAHVVLISAVDEGL